MKPRILLSLLFLLAACSPTFPSTTVPATATQTSSPTDTPTPAAPMQICLRIMPLGDSATVGENDLTYGGYRHMLWTLLTDEGYVVDFVGSQQNAEETLSDPDHEGHSGWKIKNIKNGIDENAWLETYQPNLILLHIGSNDIRHGLIQSAPENLSALLDDILQRLPEVRVIVAQVIPFAGGFVRGHDVYNDAIPAVVASKGARVSLVDMRDVLSKTDFGDYYHPLNEGYDKMARAWAEAILALDLESLQGSACP